MTTATQFEFYKLIVESDNPIGLCIVTLLAWLAASDGEISDAEAATLHQIAGAGKNVLELELAIAHAERGEVNDISAAMLYVRQMDAESKRLFLEMAIGVAVADGVLTGSENHILRLFADLCGFTPKQLAGEFKNATNQPLPAPGDPSSADWWVARERAQADARQADEPKNGEWTESRTEDNREDEWAEAEDVDHRRSRHETLNMTRVRAVAVLGLEENADAGEIRSAYRRLSRVHHPDKFAKLGPEAVEAATITFQRINAAYEYLGRP